ncbi:MAG: chromophore lyase CpcT/CpeT [Candidatus Eisenbacteria bacterium]|uniref:Chromophore lyase CpcT/CpeT n=1 Tax=Eiseniibacteriota bacterium TaxID=2212470 RepID=A0A956RQW7_UNCEI|nr:chromophore lyase CpcT/CpeT [Candidatus Eisenbacteria bacterium]
MRRRLCLAVVLLVWACAGPDDGKPPRRDQEISLPGTRNEGSALLEEWLTGSFSSAEQAAADTAYFDIRLDSVPIWNDRGPGFWIYVEQSLAARGDASYRQRVYHVTALSDSAFRSRAFTIPDPQRFAGRWREADPLVGLAPDSLEARDGCDLLLIRRDDSFVGSTSGEECRSEWNGASYATSETRITEDMIYSWDRGFDARGVQVWGSLRGGYRFRRMSS